MYDVTHSSPCLVFAEGYSQARIAIPKAPNATERVNPVLKVRVNCILALALL
jgi:hypothetical protein